MKTITISLFIIFSILVKTVCAEDLQINVGSANIRYAKTKTEEAWNKRADSLMRLVRFHEFDVFGTQEGWLHQLDDIKGADGVYEYIATPRDDGKTQGETAAVFYKIAKFELLEKGAFWFSETPEKPSFGWDAQCRRVCSWGKFRDKKTDKVFYFFCIHFDHKGVQARMNSAKMILQKVKEITKGASFFCVGDFNMSPTAAPMQIILKDGLFKDAKTSSKTLPYGPEETFHAFTGEPVENHAAPIDYIFTSQNIEVEKFGVLTDRLCKLIKGDNKIESAAEGTLISSKWSNIKNPSDHFQLLAKVIVK